MAGGTNQIPDNQGDPYELVAELEWPLGILQDEVKVRTFICACCRLMWDRLPEVAQKALVVAEDYIAGLSTAEMLVSERVKLWEYLGDEDSNFMSAEVNAVRAVICCLYEDGYEQEAYETIWLLLDFCDGVEDHHQEQYQLLSDIYGYSS